jgi:hypothetical protein
MIPRLIYLDRFRNEGTKTYSRHSGYTEANERYRPETGDSEFGLPAFEIPTSDAHVRTAHPPRALAAAYLRGDTVLFCVHPQVLEDQPDDPYLKRIRTHGDRCDPIRVAPSSSTRTLYVLDHPYPHALKVHFPFRVSRYGRRMREEVVFQAIAVSGVLERGIGAMDTRFAFLREVIGVSQKNLHPEAPRGENWGYLVRDMAPFPANPEAKSLVPGFSLYGSDILDPGTTPLLFDFIAGGDPGKLVLEEIMLPIVRHWVACFLEFGLVLEPHGQNVLLELDLADNIRRIVYRDLSLGIDMRRRREAGLPDGDLNAYNRMESGEFNSIAYDKFMGGHFFDQILESLGLRYPGLDPETFRGPCREEFARLFPDHRDYLPRTVQYFSEERDQFGKPLFQDTGRAPVWRP